jgi:hypothetical protein
MYFLAAGALCAANLPSARGGRQRFTRGVSMKRSISLVIRGRERQWGFTFEADPRHLPEWQADGLEVALCQNEIPGWAVKLGLLRPWVALQDLFFRLRRG